MTKILRAVGATFAYKMRGTSRPHAKFTGDFGSAIEVIRISDRSLLSVFAKNLEPCNFRLLQHNRPRGDIAHLVVVSKSLPTSDNIGAVTFFQVPPEAIRQPHFSLDVTPSKHTKERDAATSLD